jgi:hypothetical protein
VDNIHAHINGSEFLSESPISIFLYPHRQTTTLPEHETPEAIATWLRSRPESLSFHEFWADVRSLFARPSRFESSETHDYELALHDTGVEIRNGENALVDLDEMLDLWQQLRRHGFASDALIPVNLETRVQYLLPLLAELPYVRTVGVGRNYAELTGNLVMGYSFSRASINFALLLRARSRSHGVRGIAKHHSRPCRSRVTCQPGPARPMQVRFGTSLPSLRMNPG